MNLMGYKSFRKWYITRSCHYTCERWYSNQTCSIWRRRPSFNRIDQKWYTAVEYHVGTMLLKPAMREFNFKASDLPAGEKGILEINISRKEWI